MAFTESFLGTTNTPLYIYSTNWTCGGDGNALTSTGATSSAAIASTTGFVTVSSGAVNTWYGCPDQGVDASGRQYLKFTFTSTLAQSAFRLFMLGNSVTVDGFSMHMHTNLFLKVRNLNGDTDLWTDTVSTLVNDVLAWGVNKSASTFTVQVNGINRTTVTATTGSSGTRQGFYNIGGAGASLNKYGTNFEAGVGPIPSGSGSIVVKAVNFYSMMRNQ